MDLRRGSTIQFEWDDEKASLNERKHGVSFPEAMTVFADPFTLTGFDPDHSGDEDRFITMGHAITERWGMRSQSDC